MSQPSPFPALRSPETRTALVTGSSGGIGLAIAEALAHAGYAICVHGLASDDELQALARRLSAITGGDRPAAWSSADLCDPVNARALVAHATVQLGRLDVLVNNAGVQHVAAVEDFDPERWNFVMNVNLNAAFHATAAALPAMKARNWGRIVNVASVHGLVASAHKSAYVAAKHGLIGFTKSVALECARSGVTSNAICPGWVRTPLVERQIEARAKASGSSIAEAARALLSEKQPNSEFVEASEIGALAAFLVSDQARSITGAAINVDGGWLAQ